MPELPDVESYKKYLDSHALNKKIDHVEVKDDSILKTSAQTLRDKLKNQKLSESRRIGKNLLVKTDKDLWVVLHFGMTGYLEYFKVNGEAPKYSKVLFHFNNDHCLSFINKRKLGFVDLTDDIEKWRKDKQLGPDALDLNLRDFREIIENKKSKIKTALTDQKAIAGIGNIYADEVLFQSEIHPEVNTNDLSDDEVKEIHKKLQQVMETSIKHDAQPDELPSHYLLHYRDEGEDCPKCNGKIKKITISGRSTYFCPSCQNK
ncbi:MAG: Fpg/Nei family DNA glycosylase [Candidatus Cyclobacteriaceae bacterium M2_1C_046]